ncbi:MAG TPA: hypothetical protein VEW28_03750 [Candidatus Kapabacteria bacterium]|nr:hypothetical protein [Candidatus Kapabacteria bacterium]
MVRRLFLKLMFVVSALMFVISSNIYAQPTDRFMHTILADPKAAPYLGRDLWFAIPQNYQRNFDATRFFYIYISSPRNTTAYIQYGSSPVIVRPITANQTTVVSSLTGEIPQGAELQTSGVAENRAIHIWSKDADLSVYFLSRAPYTTDGMYCIPTIGWGTDYVVAAYASYIIDVSEADLPSEFVIVANQNNTQVIITPTTDIRKDGFPGVVDHPKNASFSVILDSGQCMQFQSTATPGDDSWDFSGTHITSNKPIGVEGGSVCPNIPVSDPSCDHVLDMMPPTRTWSNTYFSAPFDGRKFGGDLFLMVGTAAGQVIYRNGTQAAILNNKYDKYYLYDVTDASEWTSDSAFMLVQYIESSTHLAPSVANRNVGDPAEVVINPANQFGQKIIFAVPKLGGTLSGGQPDFTNYLNFILPTSHETKTTMDGKKLNQIPNTGIKRFPIPNTTWEIIQMKFLNAGGGAGNHVVVSDTTVGLYIYGYTTDDSYAWAGALGIKSTQKINDTLPPIADTAGLCFCAHIKVRDNRPGDSKLNTIVIDTSYNVSFSEDPNFKDGVGIDSSFYDICVIDSSTEAYISVSIVDMAGNVTTVISQYKPNNLEFQPCPLVFGGTAVGTPVTRYDTIYNNGKNPYYFTGSSLSLTNANNGFVIDSGQNGSDGPIPPGGFRVIKVTFTPTVKQTVKDTITIFDGCRPFSCEYLGSGGAVDFTVANYDFKCVTPDSTASSVGLYVQNTSPLAVQIDSIWVDDPVHFGYNQNVPATNKLPFTVPSVNIQSGQYGVTFTCKPTTIGPVKTRAHFKSFGGGIERTDSLFANGCGPSITQISPSDTSECDIPVTIRVQFSNAGGQYSDSVKIASIGSTDTTLFKDLFVDDGTGTKLPTPLTFGIGQTFFVDVTFTPPQKRSGTFVDSIYLIGANGDTLARGAANVVATWRDAQAATANVNFGAQPFGSPKQQKFFTICSNGIDSLTVYKVDVFPSHDAGAFRLTGQYMKNGVAVTLPIKLSAKPVECLDVYVEFDPSFILDTGQVGFFGIESNACPNADQNIALNARGFTTSGPPQIQGFNAPAILSCSNNVDTATISNSQGNLKQIVGYTITGANPANFTILSPLPINIPGTSTVPIIVGFTPTPGLGLANYSAQIVAAIIDNGQTDTSYVTSTLLQAQSNSVLLSVNHSFSQNFVKTGDYTSMIMALALTKNGLSDPISSIDIQKVVLTYNYNIDMLDLQPSIQAAFTTSIPGWAVDPANSSVNIATKTLTLTLIGTPPISDANTQLGQLAFRATVPKTGNSTPVTLTSIQLFDGSGNPVKNCIATAHLDTGITLVFQCGDSALIKTMNGLPVTKIVPVVPNPVSGSQTSVAFRYGQRGEGNISLSLYDALGNEVARILDNVHHPAGTFEVYYDTGGLPSGSYVYRYSFDNHGVQSGRLVIDR